MNPSVSVCIPVHKRTSYLRETVRKVLSQTFVDWELVIGLNVSEGVSTLIRDDLREELIDPRIRIINDGAPKNMADNWNATIRESKGDYIKLLCHDDLLYPDSLERQVRALQSNPAAVVASGARTIINSKGKVLFNRSVIRKTGLYPGRAMIRRCIMAGTNIIGDPVNVMWRRSAMEKVGAFDPSVVYCTDIEYWLRLLSVGDLYYDTRPTGFYRIHGNAAATGLGDVTVQDFVHTAKLQVKRRSVTLSAMDLRVIAWKSHLQSRLRQYLYRLLG
ncbi:MAG: glycosyltransferase [Verrucomicrobia bacterium]|jgi:glycosyltransferase involved in cell wall biosynthesis|nr:glycosyltransferase [Verrucomicrobiota bacterium]